MSTTPDKNNGITEVNVSTDNDFLYWESGPVTISEGTSLSITFKHLFPQLQIVFDATELGSNIAKATASLTKANDDNDNLPTSGTWTVGSTNVTNGQNPVAADFEFKSQSGQKWTSVAKKFLPISDTKDETPLAIAISATFANGKKSQPINILPSVDGNALSANTSYTCTIKFKMRTTTMMDGDVQTYGGGNCWVVPANHYFYKMPYSFPAYEGRTTFPAGTTTGSTVSYTKVLWMDAEGLITEEPSYDLKTNRITFVLGRGTTGNAVIAAYSADNKVCWSWHIWVVENNDFMTNPVASGHFMNRNLGATSNSKGSNDTEELNSYGLLYQWGRKDPFPGGAGIGTNTEKPIYVLTGSGKAVTIAKAAVSVADAVKNPLTFYATGGDWVRSQNDNLWNADLARYNPAPKGWTVPESSAWNGIDTAGCAFTNGYTWDSYGGWYPAAGYRSYDVGSLDGVGSDGRYWSRSAIGTFAYYLYFYDGRVNVDYYNYRAYGYSVRCVRE